MFPSLMAEIPLVFAADARQGRPAHPQIAPHATYVEEAPMDSTVKWFNHPTMRTSVGTPYRYVYKTTALWNGRWAVMYMDEQCRYWIANADAKGFPSAAEHLSIDPDRWEDLATAYLDGTRL